MISERFVKTLLKTNKQKGVLAMDHIENIQTHKGQKTLKKMIRKTNLVIKNGLYCLYHPFHLS